MDWITELLRGDSVAHAILILSLVAVLWLASGQIRVAGIDPLVMLMRVVAAQAIVLFFAH